jgi:hypothetical protein
MAGIAFICVGKRKTGKTTVSKRFLDKNKLPVKIYDINNEYQGYYNEPFDDFDVFLRKLGEDDIRGHYILIEEATIFFRKKDSEQQMINLLVRARHTRNIVQLNFHSFKSVPKDIYTLLDYVIIFKTNDVERDFKMKFDNPNVIEAFKEVKASSNPYVNKTIHLN